MSIIRDKDHNVAEILNGKSAETQAGLSKQIDTMIALLNELRDDPGFRMVTMFATTDTQPNGSLDPERVSVFVTACGGVGNVLTDAPVAMEKLGNILKTSYLDKIKMEMEAYEAGDTGSVSETAAASSQTLH